MLLALGLVVLAIVFETPLPYISRSNLLFSMIVIVLARALLPPKYFSLVFLVILLALVLVVFLPQLRIFPVFRLVVFTLLIWLLLRLLFGL